MFTNVKLAWAIPVDSMTLCAQIEAYVSTKSSLTTLRCCIKHASPGTSLGQVPAEVSGIIADYVHHNAFLKHKKTWNQDMDCWHDICPRSKHIDSDEYQRLKYDYVKSFEVWGSHDYGFGETFGYYRNQEFNEDRFEEHLRSKHVGESHHKKTVERFDATLKFGLWNRFTEDLKIMKKDFGLEVHFGAFGGCMHASEAVWRVHYKDFLAYLILPSKNVYGTTDTDSFHSLMVVDSSVKKELSEEQKLAFKRVKKVLSLTPYTGDVQFGYNIPDEAYKYHKKREGPYRLKPPTKRALRMAFQEKEVDADALEWPQFMALAHGTDWYFNRRRS